MRHTPSWATCEISLAVIPPIVSMPAWRPDISRLTGLVPTVAA